MNITDAAYFFCFGSSGVADSLCEDETHVFFKVQQIVNIVGYVFGTQIGAARMILSAGLLTVEKDPHARALLCSQFARGSLQYYQCIQTQVALDSLSFCVTAILN